MIKTRNWKSFSLSVFFGLLLISLFVFTLIGLISFSNYDVSFGNASTNYDNSGLIYYSSFFIGTLVIFLGYAAYLVPLFFLFFGFKKIFNLKTHFFLIHLLVFFLGIAALNLFISALGANGGLVGSFELKYLSIKYGNIFQNNFYFYVFLIILFIFAIFSIFYGLTIKNNIIFKLLNFFIIILSLIVRKIRLNYIFLYIKNFVKLFSFKKFSNDNIEKNNFYEKKEPGFNSKEEIKTDFIGSIKESQSIKDINRYSLPPLSLLINSQKEKYDTKDLIRKNQEKGKKLEKILLEYGVEGKIQAHKTGPLITLFDFVPAPGIKNSKVVSLSEEVARAMSSISARISSQPGKSTIGIEMPNDVKHSVLLSDLLKDKNFQDEKKSLTLALGKNTAGENIFTDLEKMPHLLIAGTTGSGKSVGLNAMILSLLFRFKPSECKFILIDPKMLELSIYEDIPHLLTPVVTNPNKAVIALKWIVSEMENRYRIMSATGVKNIQSFNYKISVTLSKGKKLYREIQTGIDSENKLPIIEKKEIPLEKMPLIVVVIDEMADLMMVAGKEVENLVQRLAQMARASGIHLIAATQRPSVDVITGTIKANFPSRISFRVASKFDSRTIINEMGAEQLLGSGDMLFLESGANLKRLHGGYVSEKEIENVVNFINSQSANLPKVDITSNKNKNDDITLNFPELKNVDELYEQAIAIVLKKQKVSTSFIQRYLQIGYNRAARIIEKMENDGIISEPNNAGKRNVLKKNV